MVWRRASQTARGEKPWASFRFAGRRNRRASLCNSNCSAQRNSCVATSNGLRHTSNVNGTPVFSPARGVISRSCQHTINLRSRPACRASPAGNPESGAWLYRGGGARVRLHPDAGVARLAPVLCGLLAHRGGCPSRRWLRRSGASAHPVSHSEATGVVVVATKGCDRE